MNVSEENLKSCKYRLPNSDLTNYEFNCDMINHELVNIEETEDQYCQEFVYSDEVYQSTAVTEFNLVCDRNHMKVHTIIFVVCTFSLKHALINLISESNWSWLHG